MIMIGIMTFNFSEILTDAAAKKKKLVHCAGALLALLSLALLSLALALALAGVMCD